MDWILLPQQLQHAKSKTALKSPVETGLKA
jgi:hypothetical protein